MKQIIAILFAYLAVSSAYRVHRINEDENHQPKKEWKSDDEKVHKAHHENRMPSHFNNADVLQAIADCKMDLMMSNENIGKDEMGCIISCVMQKFGELNKHGKLNEDKIVQDIYAKAKIDEKNARSCVAEINAQHFEDTCDVAAEYFKCIVKKSMHITK